MAQLILTPSLTDIFSTLRSFLLGILPSGTIVVRGQVNRVPEPSQSNFVVMTQTRQSRLRTNIDDPSADCLFTASIVGTVMTVTDIQIGTISPPAQIFGVGLVGGTVASYVTAQISGVTGSIGTYRVSPAQTVSSGPVSSGAQLIEQGGEWVIQLDVHGPQSSENAITITTLFRDPYATSAFEALGFPIQPLFADDPKQIPFINENQQYEDRWVVEAHLQVNQTVSVPVQYMDTVEVDLIDVDATFPPS